MPEIELKPLPMQAAQEYWKDKVPLSPGEFAQLSREAKDRAFAVSGISKGRELSTIMDAIQKAIDDGTGFEEFRDQCDEIFARRGWGTWRTETTFRTNIQTAYNVGRYREMKEVAAARPYWQYSAINDSRTRPSHAALHGRVYRADHPFWDTWYPPNGFNCRCGVVTLSQREIERDGLTVETDDPTGDLIEPVDPRNGQPMPARPLMPDPGWATNPGKNVWGGIIETSQKGTKWQTLPDLKGPDAYGRRALRNVRPSDIADLDETMLLPSGQEDDVYKAEFIRRYGEERLLTDPLGDPVLLSLRSYMDDKRPGRETWKFRKGGHGESIGLMEDIITSPYEIWLTPQQSETGGIRLAKRYVHLWKTGDKSRIAGLAIFEVADGVFQGVSAFLPKRKGKFYPEYVEAQRRGVLLYGRG